MDGWPAVWPAFLWGAATSSHQIEGGQHNDWTQWEDAGRVRERSGRAADHWQRWPEDFAIIESLHLNSYRFSLEWSRIEPQSGHVNRSALQQYRRMAQRLRDAGIVPLVTLHHFTLPLWVAGQGGFLHPDAPGWFTRYIRVVMDALGDLVDCYVTINEPLVMVVMGYLMGIWPPGHHGFRRAWSLINRLATIHALAYQTIKKSRPCAWVGLAHHTIAFEPWQETWADRATAALLRYLMNERFIRLVGENQDFIGINYYTRQYGHWSRGLHPLASRPTHPVSDLGWEIYPQGLGDILKRLQPARKPIIITENGIATTDDRIRQRYLSEHLRVIAKAQQQGIDVRGYFHWSLLDNFEWAEGYAPRFGLVGVDYATQERILRPSAELYRDIIRKNGSQFPILAP